MKPAPRQMSVVYRDKQDRVLGSELVESVAHAIGIAARKVWLFRDVCRVATIMCPDTGTLFSIVKRVDGPERIEITWSERITCGDD